MRESIEQLVARINANAFIPPPEPTSAVGEKPTSAVGERRSKMASKFKLPKNKEFNFTSAKVASKYPWDEWLTGDLLLLERSSGTEDEKGTITDITDKRDFEVARDAMPAKIKTAGRKRYKVVQISKRDHEGQPLPNEGLIIQARDMSDDERVAEDMLRAEEREKAKERRADKKGDQSEDDGDEQGTE